jgi:hypothetical protein
VTARRRPRRRWRDDLWVYVGLLWAAAALFVLLWNVAR